MMTIKLKLRYDAETQTFVPLQPVDLDHDTVIEMVSVANWQHNGEIPSLEPLEPDDPLLQLLQRMKAAGPTPMTPRRSKLTLPEKLRQDRRVDPNFDLEAWQREWDAIEAEIEHVLDPFPETVELVVK